MIGRTGAGPPVISPEIGWVMTVCRCIGVISPLWVDVTLECQCIGFCAELARSVVDDKVVHGELFQPSGLASVKHLGGCEVLEVAVVGEYLNGVQRSF